MKAKSKGKGRPLTCQWRHSGGVEVTGLLMLNLVARWEWVVSGLLRLLFYWKRALLSIVEEVVWTSLDRYGEEKITLQILIIQPILSCYMVYANSQIIDKCNIKGSLHNVCCWESSITYSECVFVALVIWHVYCQLWPVWVYHIRLINGTISRKLRNIKCVFCFFIQICLNISHFKNNSPRYYRKFMWAFMWSTYYSCPIVVLLEFSINFVKILKFHDNQSSGSWVVPCRWTDRHNEANIRFSQFCWPA
jgi:hypothetical protein